jgi:hypothetical protein
MTTGTLWWFFHTFFVALLTAIFTKKVENYRFEAQEKE